MSRDRMVCRGCGKHSGVDDLVHNALYAGIHSASFMVDVINGHKATGASSPHDIVCSNCATKHEHSARWEDHMAHWIY